MHKRSSEVPVYVALTLAVLAAVISVPTRGPSVETKLLWLLTTEAAADEARADVTELQRLGLP